MLLLVVALATARLSHHQRHMRDVRRADARRGAAEEATLRVPYDHFNVRVDGALDVRYWTDATHFDAGDPRAPLLVMLGGEGPEDATSLAGRFVINTVAAERRGFMLSIEHRFYGGSTPSLALDALRYCTAEQALMDYVAVIDAVRERFDLWGRPVVVFGGSYSGNLAAWMRQKYPGTVDASWASSAPVEARVVFDAYLEAYQDAFPGNTADLLGYAFDEYDGLVETASGRATLGRLFNVCGTLEAADIPSFEEFVGTALAGVVQYNSSYGARGEATIDRLSHAMAGDMVNRYAETVRTEILEGECFNATYAETVRELSDTTTYAEGNEEAASRSWVFQTCVAYGYYQAVSENSTLKFGRLNTYDISYDMCRDVYKIEKDEIFRNAEHVNARYGGKKPEVTNVVFICGTTDPWTRLAVTTAQKGNYVHVVTGTSHCADLYAEKASDLPELREQRHKGLSFLADVLDSLYDN